MVSACRWTRITTIHPLLFSPAVLLIRMDDLCVGPRPLRHSAINQHHRLSVQGVNGKDSGWFLTYPSCGGATMAAYVALIVLYTTWLTYRWLRPTQLAPIGPPALFGWSPPAQARATRRSSVRAAARHTVIKKKKKKKRPGEPEADQEPVIVINQEA